MKSLRFLAATCLVALTACARTGQPAEADRATIEVTPGEGMIDAPVTSESGDFAAGSQSSSVPCFVSTQVGSQ